VKLLVCVFDMFSKMASLCHLSCGRLLVSFANNWLIVVWTVTMEIGQGRTFKQGRVNIDLKYLQVSSNTLTFTSNTSTQLTFILKLTFDLLF
jgi:hypothetical protein